MNNITGYRKTKVECATYHDGYIWFISGDLPFLYRLNIQDGSTEKIVQISSYNLRKPFQYISMICVESKLYLLPWTSSQVAIYDIDNRTLEFIELDTEHSKYLFSGAIVTSEFIFSLCHNYPLVMRIRRENNKIDYCKIEVDRQVDSDDYFGGDAVVVDDQLFFTARNSSSLIILDINSLTYKVYGLPLDNITFYGIDYFEHQLVCTPNHIGDPIIFLDNNINIVKRIETSGCLHDPLAVYVDNGKYIFISLDKTLKLPDGRQLKYHHAIQKFNDGFLAYNDNREQIYLYRSHDCERIFDVKIIIEDEDLIQWCSEGLIHENYYGIRDFIYALNL